MCLEYLKPRRVVSWDLNCLFSSSTLLSSNCDFIEGEFVPMPNKHKSNPQRASYQEPLPDRFMRDGGIRGTVTVGTLCQVHVPCLLQS